MYFNKKSLLFLLLTSTSIMASDIECPKDSFAVDFTLSFSKERMQVCQKKVNDKFLKHGPEIIYNVDGSIKSKKYYQLDVETTPPVVEVIVKKCAPEATLVGDDCIPTNGKIWKGKYSCPSFQGETELLLTIGIDKFRAEFEFIAKNGRGKYFMKRTYDPSINRLAFEPTEWIQKPSNYTMIGMAGIVNFEDHTYKGKMEGCALFELKPL